MDSPTTSSNASPSVSAMRGVKLLDRPKSRGSKRDLIHIEGETMEQKIERRESEAEREAVATHIKRTYSSESFSSPDTNNLRKQKQKWEDAGQGHVFQFIEDLDETKKKVLYNQLQEIDVSKLQEYRQHAIDTDNDMKESLNAQYSALPTVTIANCSEEERRRWRDIGMKLIAAGEVAVLVLAGGQGSRLGSSDPKGMYDIKLPSHTTLFQFQGEKIRSLQSLVEKECDKKDVVIPWYVMTSPATHTETVDFFTENDFFGLKKENVLFFQQGVLPAMTPEGKVILESKSRVFVAPDGNGGLYRAMKEKGILDDMKKRGVKWIAQYCVDNILSKVGDPVFIGYSAEKNAMITCKSVKKVDPEEKVGLLVQKNGKATVVEYSEIPAELMKRVDDKAVNEKGEKELFLRAGHMCINCYNISFLEKAASEYKTKFHIARKKIPTIDDKGEKFAPPKENGWKLEQFIFDPFEYSNNVFVFEVPREEEFSALKNPPGTKTDSPDSSRQDLSNLHKSWIKKAGGKIIENSNPEDSLCEISPLISYDGEGLEEFVRGKEFQMPLYLK